MLAPNGCLPDRTDWDLRQVQSSYPARHSFVYDPPITQPARWIRAKGLGIGGKRLWKRVTSAYTLRIDELVLLENAARTVDILARLDEAMIGQPLTVKGSMGQEREHPLLSEARQQRAAVARLLAQLRLPDVDVGRVAAEAGGRSHQAREAALARWS